MARAYLFMIFLGAVIAAMLPSGSNSDRAAAAAERSGGKTLIVASRDGMPAGSGESLASSVVSGQGTTLDRSPDGHFYADAQVNGVTVHFLVDTGASGVALSAADARRVGLPFFHTEFTAVGRGASGEVRGKLVTLDRVTLGGKSVEKVDGAILEGSEMSLLGQSFLSRMGTIEMTPDRMVIR